MQIVIDIPDGCYEELKTASFPVQEAYRLVSWIKDGTPLPKGHGRLIDAEVFVNNIVKYSHQSTKTIGQSLTDTPTIIEADKAGEEE